MIEGKAHLRKSQSSQRHLPAATYMRIPRFTVRLRSGKRALSGHTGLPCSARWSLPRLLRPSTSRKVIIQASKERSSAALIEGPSTTIAIKRGPNSLQRERWQQRLMTPDHASRLATIAKCLRQGTYIGRTAGDGMARLQRHDGRISRAQQTVCRTVRSLEAAAEIQLRCRIRSAQPAAVGPNAS